MTRVVVVTGPGGSSWPSRTPAELPRRHVPGATTLFSGISAGTELSFVKGTNPYLHAALGRRPRPVPARARRAPPYPVTRLGYMEVGAGGGEPDARRSPRARVVAMTYGHRTGYVADPLADRIVPLPDDLDPLLGVFVAHMGPICANGLLHAAADLYGADVRSLGDGVRGRRVAVSAPAWWRCSPRCSPAAHGAASVVVLDPTPAAPGGRRGARPGDPRPGRRRPGRGAQDPVAARRRGPGRRRGVPVPGPGWALHLALRLLRPQGTVIDLAFYQGGADAVRLGEEFHHNGLSLRCAQIGRVPRGLAPTWDRERLSAETIDLLRRTATDPQST